MPDHPRNRAGFATRTIHAGQSPDPTTGAIMTPIYATSTYVQESPGVHKGYEYSRTQNPTRLAFEACIADLESGASGFAFASGMAATATILELLDAGAQLHRVDARGEVALAGLQDRLGENRRRRGAVTSDVVGLARHLLHELGAHVLEGVFEFDLLGDGDAVLGDLRAAEGLLENDVLARRAESDLDRPRQALHSHDGLPARHFVEHDLLG